MEIDVIDQLKRQMGAFGVAVFCWQPPYPEQEDFNLGLQRILCEGQNLQERVQKMLKFGEERTIYIVRDTFEENFVSFQIPEPFVEENTQAIMQIGPYITEPPETLLDKVMEQNRLPLYLREEIEEYYYGVPYIKSCEALETLIILQAGYLFGGRERVRISRVENYSEQEPELREHAVELGQQKNMLQIEERYRYEDQMLDAVKKGDLEKVIETNKAIQSYRLKPRNKDSLRDDKNLMIVWNTLFRKAVQAADVHPAHIDKISERFARQIEAASCRKDLDGIAHEMRRKYCLLVRNHSLKGCSPIVRDALNYIDFNLKEALSLKLLAERESVNASYLSTQFKKETGKTLTDYINEKRIQSSLVLLATTDLSIQEVAEQVGIYDENYFARLFKKYKNLTAKQYRNLMKSKF